MPKGLMQLPRDQRVVEINWGQMADEIQNQLMNGQQTIVVLATPSAVHIIERVLYERHHRHQIDIINMAPNKAITFGTGQVVRFFNSVLPAIGSPDAIIVQDTIHYDRSELELALR